MKKLLWISLMILPFSLMAAKVAAPDENGRIYGAGYFDIKSDTQSPILDIIEYSKRVGTFDWTKLYNSLQNFTADRLEFKISTRVEIPSDISTSDVYVSIGENFQFSFETCCDSRGAGSTILTKSSDARSVYIFDSYVNDAKLSSSDAILTKTKTDSFGNRYVDLILTFIVDITEGKSYIPFVRGNAQEIVKTNFAKNFDSIKIKVAPKSRTFQSQWVEPKIYVLDE